MNFCHKWIVPAVMCAVLFGVSALYIRFLHLKKISSTPLLLFSYFFFALPILIIPAAAENFSPLLAGFWPVALLVAFGNVAGFYSFINALKHSETSLVMPVLALSPLAVIPISAVLLKETPGKNALFAILIITAGCYILTSGEKLTEPFKKIRGEKGVRWAALTVIIWAFIANLDKIALMKSSKGTYPFILSALIAAMSFPFILKKRGDLSKKNVFFLAILGIINAGLLITHFAALSLAQVSYVIAVKRSGVLIGVLGGIIFFREKEPVKRLFAAAIILAGNIMLYLNG